MDKSDNNEWERLNYEEKTYLLFKRQKRILDMFLERGAISQEQYDKGEQELNQKMF